MISPTVLPSCSKVCICTCHNVVMIQSRRHGLLPARTYHPACPPVITKYSTSRLVTQDPLGTKRLLLLPASFRRYRPVCDRQAHVVQVQEPDLQEDGHRQVLAAPGYTHLAADIEARRPRHELG